MHKLSSNILKTAAMALMVITAVSLSSCHESLEDRAEREAKEYTEKYCPTPPQNDVITDSMTFDKATKTQTYYLRFTGIIDNVEAIREHGKELEEGMLRNIRNNGQLEVYKKAGFTFVYVCRSQKNPETLLLKMKFGPKDYNK